MKRYAKNGGAARRRFCAIGEKPEGGVSKHPPGPARVKTLIIPLTDRELIHQIRLDAVRRVMRSLLLETTTNDWGLKQPVLITLYFPWPIVKHQTPPC